MKINYKKAALSVLALAFLNACGATKFGSNRFASVSSTTASESGSKSDSGSQSDSAVDASPNNDQQADPDPIGVSCEGQSSAPVLNQPSQVVTTKVSIEISYSNGAYTGRYTINGQTTDGLKITRNPDIADPSASAKFILFDGDNFTLNILSDSGSLSASFNLMLPGNDVSVREMSCKLSSGTL